MLRTKLNFHKGHRAHRPGPAVAAILLAAVCPGAIAQQPGQRTFPSAEDASKALVTAAQNNDEKAMLDILGPDGKQIIASGDDTEDARNRADFVNAPGGARNYMVNGSMTKGFAFAAFPAEYQSSGVMTFIVNQTGVVYEKDLGKKTGDLARTMNEYNPTSGWRKAEALPGDKRPTSEATSLRP